MRSETEIRAEIERLDDLCREGKLKRKYAVDHAVARIAALKWALGEEEFAD